MDGDLREPRERPAQHQLNEDTTETTEKELPSQATAVQEQHGTATSQIASSSASSASVEAKSQQIPISQAAAHYQASTDTGGSEQADPDGTARPFHRGRLPLRSSLGGRGYIIIFGGSVSILGVIGFLTFLWFGHGNAPEAADATWTWRQIALRDWMTRAITVSSLVLRFVTSLQVAACTSMIAALVLEKRVTRKSDVAYLSVTRGIDDGPRRLVQLLLSSGTTSVFAYIELWLISLLALVILGLQFSSTILISDVHDFAIVGDLEVRSIVNLCSFVTSDATEESPFSSIVYSFNPVYATYGEEKLDYSSTPEGSGFSDTGLGQRGFLPLMGSENRTLVRQYHGTTLIFSSRTVCVAPEIDVQFLPQFMNKNSTLPMGYGRMTGSVDYGLSLRQAYPDVGPLCTNDGCEVTPFDCLIPSGIFNDSGQPGFCFLETVGRTTETLSFGNFELNAPEEPWAINSIMHLIYRGNLTYLDWLKVVENSTLPPPITVNEWKTFQLMHDRTVNISLCFSSLYVEPRHVALIAPKPIREPISLWDGITPQHDTTEISRFIGATDSSQTLSERGVLSISISPASHEYDTALSPGNLSSAYLQQTVTAFLSSYYTPSTSYFGCVYCHGFSVETHPELQLLFSDIIASTGHATTALHSFINLIAISVYDKMIKSFNVTEEVKMSTVTTVRTPGPCSSYHCTGFVFVITLVGVHLIIVAAITTLYAAQVRHSRYSNIWHAISQLMGEDLSDVLEQANAANDEAITKTLKREGRDDFMKLELLDDGSRVQIVKHADDRRERVESKRTHPVDATVEDKSRAKGWLGSKVFRWRP